MDKTDKYTVADINLAESGSLRVDWARARMPVLAALKEEALNTKPLAGMRVAGCLHVTKETAVLIETIAAAGAEILLCFSPSSSSGRASVRTLAACRTTSTHCRFIRSFLLAVSGDSSGAACAAAVASTTAGSSLTPCPA